MNKRPTTSQESGAFKRLRAASPSHLYIVLLLVVLLQPEPNEARTVHKRSIIENGCRGNYVPSFEQYYFKLERFCEECYILYRDPGIAKQCPKDCFRNDVFRACIQALMLETQMKGIDKMISVLAG